MSDDRPDEALSATLDDAFDPAPGERRAVARAARDLADTGRLAEDRDTPLTPELVVAELREAPAGLSLAERWNWWVGALELAHGGYAEFEVRRFRS